jgi:hypothetical protein
LNNDTICGLLSCKFNQNQGCYEYQPSASVLKLICIIYATITVTEPTKFCFPSFLIFA